MKNRVLSLIAATLLVATSAIGEDAEVVKPIQMDPEKLAGVGLPKGEQFIAEENVLAGNHRPRGEVLYYGEQLILEVYEDDAATFRIAEPTGYDEYVLIMDGKLILTDAGGESHEFVAGDSLIVPKGFKGTWQMLGNFREFIVIEREAYEAAWGAP